MEKDGISDWICLSQVDVPSPVRKIEVVTGTVKKW